MKKIGMAILLCSLCVLVLTSCGASTKSEKQILEDLQAEDFMLYHYKWDDVDMEIIKRQTNEDDKEDFVWCSVKAETDDFTYENEYELKYVLYNDGWLLEETQGKKMLAYTFKQNVIMIDEDTILADIADADAFFDANDLEVTSVMVYDADFPTATEWEFSDTPTGYWDAIYHQQGIFKWYQVDVEAQNSEFTYLNSYTVSYQYDYDRWELHAVEGADSYEQNFLDAITFQSAQIEAVAREMLNIPSGGIRQGDVDSITELDLAGKGIDTISDLAYFENLEILYAYGNEISDISALSGLTNLTELYLGDNNISNISALSSLTNLTELGLYTNKISNISALSGLTNLTKLGLGANNISDISALSGLINLTGLSSYSNNISNISALSGLTNLTTLDLVDNNIEDFSPVSHVEEVYK